MNMNFVTTPKMDLAIRSWAASHVCKNRGLSSTLTYRFTPVGIGTVVKIKCTCGKKLDVTDYTIW